VPQSNFANEGAMHYQRLRERQLSEQQERALEEAIREKLQKVERVLQKAKVA